MLVMAHFCICVQEPEWAVYNTDTCSRCCILVDAMHWIGMCATSIYARDGTCMRRIHGPKWAVCNTHSCSRCCIFADDMHWIGVCATSIYMLVMAHLCVEFMDQNGLSATPTLARGAACFVDNMHWNGVCATSIYDHDGKSHLDT